MAKRLLYTGILGAIVVFVVFAALLLRPDVKTVQDGGEIGIGGAPPTTSPQQIRENNIVSVLEENGNFSIFLESLRLAGMLDRLDGPEEFTIFAPTDEAFARVGSENLAPMFSNRDALRAVLESHMVQGNIPGSELGSVSSVRSIEGTTLELSEISVNEINISQKDIKTSNGVIHAIDELILPPNYLLEPREEI